MSVCLCMYWGEWEFHVQEPGMGHVVMATLTWGSACMWTLHVQLQLMTQHAPCEVLGPSPLALPLGPPLWPSPLALSVSYHVIATCSSGHSIHSLFVSGWVSSTAVNCCLLHLPLPTVYSMQATRHLVSMEMN